MKTNTTLQNDEQIPNFFKEKQQVGVITLCNICNQIQNKENNFVYGMNRKYKI